MGTQTTTLQGVNTKVGAQVGLTATAPNMALSSRPKRPSILRNTSNYGSFGTEVEISPPQRKFRRPSDSRKTASSKRGTIDGVMAGKDGTATATTPSDSRDRPPSRRSPAKRASPSRYVEKPRQHVRTDTADIEAVVFASLYPEGRAKSATTVPFSEGEIGGRIPAPPATPP